MSIYKSASDAGHNRGESTNHNILQPNYSLNPLNALLERVENVRVSGKGYRGDCPNGHRGRGSLSMRESDDGSVLLHCHSGCSCADVLHTLSLEMKDLFWRKDFHSMTSQEKREIREKARQTGWKTALELLPLELAVIKCAAVQMSKGKPLNMADHQRLELAVVRVNSAMAVLCGH